MSSLRLLTLAFLLLAPTAHAGELYRVGDDHERADDSIFDYVLDFRLRAELLYNLDLDRGLTPDGTPLFPTPVGDPDGQILTAADMRVRSDLALYTPGGGLAVKTRIDIIDNLALGSAPTGPPLAATSQDAPIDAFRIKRIWAEALTPFGLISAGRMGNDWGLGMLANGGDCADCDSGDAADRIAFVTPLVGHIWAAAFDFSAIGPTTPRVNERRVLDIDPSDDVRTLTFAFMHYTDPLAIDRRRRANRLTLDYGAYVSYRWQDNDIPESYLPTATPDGFTASDVVRRDYSATAIDGWFRVVLPWLRVEIEAAVLLGEIGQSSLVPGVELEPVTTTAWGLAFESNLGTPDSTWGGGLDFGVASGDDAPGFGARVNYDTAVPTLGDLDGPQALPPGDTTADNFRFHPDYRIDRILFREIIGTVTDAFYLRPHARFTLGAGGPSVFEIRLAGVFSTTLNPESAPGGDELLGFELDPTIEYRSRDGFRAALDYALLIPLAGLDNPAAGLTAQVAQSLRLRLSYHF